jgi:arsenite methyltransferase
MTVTTSAPDWLRDVLGADIPPEDGRIRIRGQELVMREGILRSRSAASGDQEQTERAFAYKWRQRESFESEVSLRRMREWLIERYGNVTHAPWWDDYGPRPLVVDAGCGAAASALALFGNALSRARYLGVDVSPALEIAAERFAARGIPAAFIQADITQLPLPPGSVDVVFSEGVLHHTGDTEASLRALIQLLAPSGRILFYVYRKKGPIREFTDDYVRDRVSSLSPTEAWEAMMPLTKLGKALGDLEVEVEIPERVGLLDIPAGRISVQRLFYWHVFKAYHHRGMSLQELNHINYDWYAPAIAHRHSPDEVLGWCEGAGLEIQHENLQQSGITIIARRPA